MVRLTRYQFLVVGMWIAVTLAVALSFVIRVPCASIHIEATAENVMFSTSGLELLSPSGVRDWFLHAQDFRDGSEQLDVTLWALPKGSKVMLGKSDRYYPPYHLALAAWGPGTPNVEHGFLRFVSRDEGWWILFGVPVFDSEEDRAISQPFEVYELAVRSVTGAALSLDYEASELRLLSTEQVEVLQEESRVVDASIRMMGQETKLNSGDALWFGADHGEIRTLNVSDDSVHFTYDGVVESVFAITGGRKVELTPSVFVWLMSFSIVSKGVVIALGLGGMVFATVNWWKRATGNAAR